MATKGAKGAMEHQAQRFYGDGLSLSEIAKVEQGPSVSRRLLSQNPTCGPHIRLFRIPGFDTLKVIFR